MQHERLGTGSRLAHTRPPLAIVVLALTSACQSPGKLAVPEAGALPPFPMPLWFDEHATHGLEVADGALVAGGKRLVVDLPLARLAATAYHESAGLVTAVIDDGTVVLYQEQRGRLREVARRAAPEGKTYRFGLLTRVPGLAYVVDVDVAWRARRHDSRTQEYDATHFERVAVTPSAGRWDAITTFASVEELVRSVDRAALLEGVYRSEQGALWLSLEPGQWKRLSLPLPIDAPKIRMWGGPTQAVFSLGEHGIVCKLLGGWSVYGADGTKLGWASTEGTPEGQWNAPTFEVDPISSRISYIFNVETGPSGETYRLDLEQQKLVPAHPR
jgi:hypothetical protein